MSSAYSSSEATEAAEVADATGWTDGPWPGPLGANASHGALAALALPSWTSVGPEEAATAVALAVNASRLNDTLPALPAFCEGWEVVQNNLFQVSNLFFCIAFLVPRHFKQSMLLYRFLLMIGSMLTAVWASFHLCAFDVFVWSVALMLVNAAHTAALVVRFLPPALSPDLTELYLKVFRPLKVSKKAFKELAREGSVLTLEPGDTYAVEEQTPADERLSILLKGRLAVSCGGTHLHHILGHQFVDSPEWESNHDTSENTFQVTVSAEEESVYLCWQRIKLTRVLRHRPHVRVVLDTLIGKDITHKLYSLNEQMHGHSVSKARSSARARRRLVARSVSVDAVHMGTRGHVRSAAFKGARKERAASAAAAGEDALQAALQSPARHGQQSWIPLVANHFPVSSPFVDELGQPQPLLSMPASVPGMLSVPGVPGVPGVPLTSLPSLPLTAMPGGMTGVAGVPVSGLPGGVALQVPSSMALVPVPVIVPVLAPPPTLHQARSRNLSRSLRRGGSGGGGGGVGVPLAPPAAATVKFEATPV